MLQFFVFRLSAQFPSPFDVKFSTGSFDRSFELECSERFGGHTTSVAVSAIERRLSSTFDTPYVSHCKTSKPKSHWDAQCEPEFGSKMLLSLHQTVCCNCTQKPTQSLPSRLCKPDARRGIEIGTVSQSNEDQLNSHCRHLFGKRLIKRIKRTRRARVKRKIYMHSWWALGGTQPFSDIP